MHVAAENGQSEVLKIIIEAGGDVAALEKVHMQILCMCRCT